MVPNATRRASTDVEPLTGWGNSEVGGTRAAVLSRGRCLPRESRLGRSSHAGVRQPTRWSTGVFAGRTEEGCGDQSFEAVGVPVLRHSAEAPRPLRLVRIADRSCMRARAVSVTHGRAR